MGTVSTTEDGRHAVRFERRLAHPPHRVWRAITEPEQLKAWFPAVVEFDLTPGARISYHPTPEQLTRLDITPDDVEHGEMLRVDPPHLLEYTWGAEIVRWELSGDGAGGTHLVFTNILDDRDTAIAAGAGWHAGLEVVEAQLDNRPVDWIPWDRADELTPDYLARG